MTELFLKSTTIWIAFLVLAVVNAGLREKVLDPLLGSSGALLLSGLLLVTLLAPYVCAKSRGLSK